MITIQIDSRTDRDVTSVWSGIWPQVPAEGDTIEVRQSDDYINFYLVVQVHWIMFADEHTGGTTAVVTVEEWIPEREK